MTWITRRMSNQSRERTGTLAVRAVLPELAHGGLNGHVNEYLSDGSKNFAMSFAGINTEHLYLGSDSKFRGVNIALATKGAGTADLQWEY